MYNYHPFQGILEITIYQIGRNTQPCLRSHLAAKDLFAILDVVNDEFGYSAEPLFVTEREEVR